MSQKLPSTSLLVDPVIYGRDVDKEFISNWLTSEVWDFPLEESNIIPALISSYHQLPSHLKRCFAYCALFPKNYLFKKEHLILLWMAENVLQCPRQSMSMEEVGEQYFNYLGDMKCISSCMTF